MSGRRDPSTVYVGTRNNGFCSIKRRGELDNINLRLDLCSHSPTGFDWGYGGSGPAQTALAILADYLGHDQRAFALHQDFKWALVCGLPHWGWEITGAQIDALLDTMMIGRLA